MGPSVRPGFLLAVIGLQFVAASMEMNSRKFEPMVAFICNKPAMHRVPSGWVADEDTSKSCVKQPEEILDYCKKLYPDHDITNVLQASYKVTIPNWCGFNVTHCHKHGNHTIRPFRCLVGPFQSEALLVPEHCIFDHYHDPRVCNEFDQCNETAMSKCSARGMTTQSFAMLWPCQEPGHFSGVEFVCCPKVSLIPEQVSESEKSTEAPKSSSPPAASKSESDLDDYTAYLKGDSKYLSKYANEHERFKAAEKVMQQFQRERDTKMMKDWKAARDSVREKKKTDPKKAMELNKELTERYQKIYHAYEQESIAEKKQLVNTHQQHIQSLLNNRKQVLMEKLQDALLAKPPKKSKIEKAATAYIKVEERDKMHTYNHFQHLRDTDPEDASNIQDRVLEHLNLIDDRIRRVLDWLKRDPEIEKQVRPNIDKFMLKYKDINANSMKLLLQEPTPKDTPVETPKAEDYSEEDEAAVTRTADKVKPTEAHPEQQEDIKAPGFDSETFEDERPVMEQTIHDLPSKKQYIAHVQHQPMIANQVSLDNLYANNHANSVLGIAIGGVAVFIIIVVAVVMLKRRSQRQRVTHGFVEVDPAASPEERHVANMQMNGYENPTYKYFEMQSQ